MFSGRISPRRKIFQIGKVYDGNGNCVVDCFVRDVSATGARLQLRQDVTLPNSFVLVLTEDGSVRRRCDKVWQFSIVAGVRFAGKLGTTEQSP